MIEIGLQSTIRYPFFLSPDLHCRSLYPEDPSGRSGVLRLFIPYFSRRIGLSDDGQIVPIKLATKVAGRLGKTEIGFTHALLEKHGEVDENNVFAARVTQDILDESEIGFIATAGDPGSNNDSFLLGVDFRYQNSHFQGDKQLIGNVFGLWNTFDTDDGDSVSDYAYGLNFRYPNDVLSYDLYYGEVGEDFDPALGYVQRTGVRNFGGSIGWKYRPNKIDWFRSLSTTFYANYFYRLEGGEDSTSYTWTLLRGDLASSDEFYVSVSRRTDNPSKAFSISDTTIEGGDYIWWDLRARYNTTNSRPLSMGLGCQVGEFYDGHRYGLSTDVVLRANRHFELTIDYNYNHFDLPGGQFDTHVARVGTSMNFTPDLTWSNLLQYDSVSNDIGLNSRLRWEFRPGATAYLSLNQSYLYDQDRWQSTSTDLSVKTGASFRF